MKENQKTSQHGTPASGQVPAAGPDGAAIAPPEYGMQGIDHGLAQTQGLVIQPRLMVGAADDPYEHEADRVAQRVMRMSEPSDWAALQRREANTRPLSVRRAGGGAGFEASSSIESAISDQQGNGGAPLPSELRNFMEPRFGADFGAVRVHTDARADELNHSLNARAFTTGQDIFFKQADYNPKTPTGKELIAHELTHVLQQNGGPVRRVQRRLWVNAVKILDVDDAWDKVKDQVTEDRQVEGKKLLRTWITSAGGLHFQFRGMGSRLRLEYDNWGEVAVRLNHDLDAQENLVQENQVALDLSESAVIKKEVGDAVKFISAKVGWRVDPRTWKRASENYRRKIAWYKSILYLVSHVHSYPLRKIFEILKYVTEEYASLKNVTKVEYQGNFLLGEEEIGEDEKTYQATKLSKSKPYRKNWWTPEESHPWVQQARAVHKPIMAGASNTTHRTLEVAQSAGCTANQLESIAWAAFIYWNRSPKNIAFGHTFHEVMDVANAGFNVPYNQAGYDIPARYTEEV